MNSPCILNSCGVRISILANQLMALTPLSTRFQGGCVILFNPLAAPPCNRAIAWIEVDHLLQKYWRHAAIYHCTIQI